MTTVNRVRSIAAGVVAVVIPLGLLARRFRSQSDGEGFTGFVALYLADTLWPVMFYGFARFVWPLACWKRVAVGVLLFTWSIEISQLVQADWLLWLRAQPGIGFALGDRFSWSDLKCCLVGTVLAAATDVFLRRKRTAEIAAGSG